VALEKKQGISNLELMCQELLNEEMAKQQKKELKKQKKKRKKNKANANGDSPQKEDGDASDPEMPSACQCHQTSKNKENCKVLRVIYNFYSQCPRRKLLSILRIIANLRYPSLIGMLCLLA
jgi:hypothetical protein